MQLWIGTQIQLGEDCILMFIKNPKIKPKMKDTVEVLAANGGALGLTLTQCNEILQFISLALAIGFTVYKFAKGKKK